MKHTAIIVDGVARCSCGRWNGTLRDPDETNGEFTKRAWDLHVAHAAAQGTKHEGQQAMFATQEEMFT